MWQKPVLVYLTFCYDSIMKIITVYPPHKYIMWLFMVHESGTYDCSSLPAGLPKAAEPAGTPPAAKGSWVLWNKKPAGIPKVARGDTYGRMAPPVPSALLGILPIILGVSSAVRSTVTCPLPLVEAPMSTSSVGAKGSFSGESLGGGAIMRAQC